MDVRKDRSYEHEQELRAVLWGLGPEGGDSPLVSCSFSPEGKYIFHGPSGVEIPCDPERLITEIMIWPREQQMFEKVLEPILGRYGLTIPVTASDRLKSR